MLIHSDPNNMNSIVYHLIIVRYSMKTLHWYFPWATALHLHNMTSRGGKLQQLHCYHPFSDSLDIYLTKNHYENYSPKMVPIAKIWGPGSWTIRRCNYLKFPDTDAGLASLYKGTYVTMMWLVCIRNFISRRWTPIYQLSEVLPLTPFINNIVKKWYDVVLPMTYIAFTVSYLP